jgi:hypothetical protein
MHAYYSLPFWFSFELPFVYSHYTYFRHDIDPDPRLRPNGLSGQSCRRNGYLDAVE